jgi:hypothetical protein
MACSRFCFLTSTLPAPRWMKAGPRGGAISHLRVRIGEPRLSWPQCPLPAGRINSLEIDRNNWLHGASLLDGSAFWAAAAPRILRLSSFPFPLHSRGLPLTVGFHLPPADSDVEVFPGFAGDGFVLWMDPWGNWHVLAAEPLSPVASGPLYAEAVDGILYSEEGVFSALDLSMLPSGMYEWGMAVTDRSGQVLGPITWAQVILY